MHKALLLLFLFFNLFLTSFTLRDGDCKGYYPVRQGVTTEVMSYTAKDENTGTTRESITSVTNSGDTTILSITKTSNDPQGKQVGSMNYKVKCCNGVIFIDMNGMNLTDSKEQWDSKAKVTTTSDFLNIPNNPVSGQQLKNGSMTVTIVEPNVSATGAWHIKTTVSKRKVLAKQKITTPAGTFDCIKISYDVTTKTIFDIKTHITEWYAMNVGIVRTERYSDKWELQSYSVLTNISGN